LLAELRREVKEAVKDATFSRERYRNYVILWWRRQV